jgi:hypothetical protein
MLHPSFPVRRIRNRRDQNTPIQYPHRCLDLNSFLRLQDLQPHRPQHPRIFGSFLGALWQLVDFFDTRPINLQLDLGMWASGTIVLMGPHPDTLDGMSVFPQLQQSLPLRGMARQIGHDLEVGYATVVKSLNDECDIDTAFRALIWMGPRLYSYRELAVGDDDVLFWTQAVDVVLKILNRDGERSVARMYR